MSSTCKQWYVSGYLSDKMFIKRLWRVFEWSSEHIPKKCQPVTLPYPNKDPYFTDHHTASSPISTFFLYINSLKLAIMKWQCPFYDWLCHCHWELNWERWSAPSIVHFQVSHACPSRSHHNHATTTTISLRQSKIKPHCTILRVTKVWLWLFL